MLLLQLLKFNLSLRKHILQGYIAFLEKKRKKELTVEIDRS